GRLQRVRALRARASALKKPRTLELIPHHLNEPAAVALAIELDEEHALPRAEAELAVAHRDGLTGGSEQHRHAVGVPVAEVHVLRADVLGALVPVVMRVIGLSGNEALQQLAEVLDESGLELVHPNTAGRVRRVDARDPLDDAAFLYCLVDLVGDVPDGQASGGSQLPLALEDLHRPLF